MAGGNPERARELLTFDLQLRNAVAAGCSLEGADEMSALPSARALFPLLHPMPRLVGFDEAGRGALAGPVAVGCVAFNLQDGMLPGDGVAFSFPEELGSGGHAADDLCSILCHLDDSKRVTPKRRDVLFDVIRAAAQCGIGYASAAEIDRWGIGSACRRAAARALSQLGVPVGLALFDRGLSLPDETPLARLPGISLTRGDSRSFHVAAASILAKVSRDRLMERFAERFPGYGLAKHKGYGTPAHRQAILERGPTRIHRRTFTRNLEMAKSQSC